MGIADPSLSPSALLLAEGIISRVSIAESRDAVGQLRMENTTCNSHRREGQIHALCAIELL